MHIQKRNTVKIIGGIKFQSSIFYYFIFFFCLNFIFTNTFSQNTNNDWPGWRGLEKQGVQQISTASSHWDSTKNIAWKTAIPGSGHSSPIIAGNNVIVTTAYHQENYIIIKKIIQTTIILLTLFLIIYLLFFIGRIVYKSIKITKLNFLNIWGYCFIIGFVFYYSLTGIFFNINDSTDHITQSTRWFFSGMIVSLFMMLLSYTINEKLWSKLVLICTSILFSIFIIIFRPAPEYYALTGDGSLVIMSIKSIILPLIIAVVIFMSIFFKRASKAVKKNEAKKLTWIRKIFLIAGSVAFFIFGSYGIGIYRMVRYSNPSDQFSLPLLDIYFRDSNVFMFIVLVCLFIWIFFYISKIFSIQEKKSKWITVAVIGLAILVFINKNYLIGASEYVRAVICLDKETGKIKWTREAFKGDQAIIHPDNSPASPTPLINNNLIYAYFGSPGLICINMEGKIIWKNTDLPFEDIHGVAASPMFSNGFVIILSDMPKKPYITAFDGNTGKQVWKIIRKPWVNNHAAYRTPTIKKIIDTEMIFTWGMYGMNAYDALSGKELFDYPLSNSIGQLVASIIISGDTLFAPERDKFYAFSINKLFLKINPEIWSTNMKHKGPLCASPVLYNKLLFMVSDNGYATCLDAISGKNIWSKKLPGIYMASCTIINGNIYVSNTVGLTTIIAAEKTFKIIAENQLPEPIYASIAPTSTEILIRTTEHLWCIK